MKAAAQTFRQNKKIDVVTAIAELSVGEALVSFLDEQGQPSVVDRAWAYPPQSQLPPLTPSERQLVIKQSTLYGHYEKTVDRESAYEMLKGRAPCSAAQLPSGAAGGWQAEAGKLHGALAPAPSTPSIVNRPRNYPWRAGFNFRFDLDSQKTVENYAARNAYCLQIISWSVHWQRLENFVAAHRVYRREHLVSRY